MKSVAVIGVGQFGNQIAVSMSQKGYEVIAIDKDVEIISEIKDLVHQAIILDSTEEKAMRSVNIDNVDLAVVAIGSNVQSSLLTTALLKRIGVTEIHVRVINPLQESIIKSMGVSRTVNIEKEMGIMLSNTLSSGVGRYIEISERHSLIEIKVPEKLIGKTLKDLNIREQFRINIVGIKVRIPDIDEEGLVKYKSRMMEVPDPSYPLTKNDMLVIAGTDENLTSFISSEKG